MKEFRLCYKEQRGDVDGKEGVDYVISRALRGVQRDTEDAKKLEYGKIALFQHMLMYLTKVSHNKTAY